MKVKISKFKDFTLTLPYSISNSMSMILGVLYSRSNISPAAKRK
jgi:hypothetical protein